MSNKFNKKKRLPTKFGWSTKFDEFLNAKRLEKLNANKTPEQKAKESDDMYKEIMNANK